MGKEYVLWFDSPAQDDEWETRSLPIGNGNFGASIFGGAEFEGKHREKLTLSEKTFWAGGPSPNYEYDGGNRRGGYEYVKKVQSALSEGRYEEALSLLPNLTGGCEGYGAFCTLGNLYFTFEGINETLDYRRRLSLKNGVASVTFRNGNEYNRREYFASHPAELIAAKFTTEGGTHTFSVSMDNIPEGGRVFSVGGGIAEDDVSGEKMGVFTMSGHRPDNGLKFHLSLRVYTDGEVTAEPFGVKGGTKTVIYIAAATNYANVYPNYRSEYDPAGIVRNRLDAAAETRYGALLLEHQADFARIMDRAELDLGAEIPEFPVDCLLDCYKNRDDENTRRCVEEMYFRYGRYLLFSSSRDGLPANLQGVWNNTNTPPWSGDYHINVNLQMNYWPAYVTNMAETAIPLIDFVDSLREPGRVTAAEYCGIVSDEENPENGWIAHTQSTPFGWTCPGWDFYWGWSTAAAAWLCQNIWEYYEFTGDEKMLREKIYPIMRESVKFYLSWLIYDRAQDRMVSSPSYSPEHGPVTAGNTYEQSLIEQLFTDFMAAAEILQEDEALRDRVKKVRSMLKPYAVGERGQLKEWFYEDSEGFDSSAVQKGHRHVSHLLGLYPGKAINSGTPELMRAAVVTLNERGDESTGWARAMKLCLWARTGDGNRAYKLLSGLLTDSTLPNMWDTHPPFQIDGNFGGTAGIAEMLLQSHEGYIHVLPSLPFVWKKAGSFTGLCARGGFEVSCRWENGSVTELKILSHNGGVCRVKVGENFFEFDTEAGKEYEV